MAEEQIVTNIVAKSDFSNLIADLNKVSSALLNLQAKLNATNKNLSSQVNVMNRSFAETLRSTGQYSTHFVSLSSDVEKFGTQLDKGQIKLKQFAQIYQTHIKTSGGLVRQLAQQQVQLQNAILQPLGKNAEGLMQYNVQIPAGLDKVKNAAALTKQEIQIMNKVVQEGANQLINWGKNTQWAGRQLTVGLTLPLAAFGKASADAFKQADQELVRLTKVYGGIAATSTKELGQVRKDVAKTAADLSKTYGSSFKDTLALAADIAATGKQGNELLGSIKETTRLSVLGEVDRQDAMKATLAIQTAFKQNTEQLSESINFLNAVENQTSTTLGDLVEAIPKAGPVIKGLGGDVKDLALYLTAMREGGISATEAANALKSGLASLINPTKTAQNMFAGFGINLKNIVEKNAGHTTATILELQAALDKLNPLQKQQALEQLFGKFQFARMNALFSNLGKQGSQTLAVLDLMKASSQDLANIAGRELSQVTESASGKYRRALEGLKADLAGVGEQFLNINTHLINIVDGILKFVNKLPGPVKTILGLFGGLTAVAGPLIMLTGVLGNFFGYIIKGVSHMRALTKGGEGWKLLTPEILAANKAGGLVEQTFYSDAKASDILNQAIQRLSASYEKLAADASKAMILTNPGVSTLQGTPITLNKVARVANPAHPLIGAIDTRAAAHTNPVGLMTQSEKNLQTIHSVTPNPIAVNQAIGKTPQIFTYQNMPNIPGLTTKGGVSTGIVAGEAAKWHTLMATLSMQTKQEVAQLRKEIYTTGTVSQDFLSSYSTILPAMTQVIDNAVIESQKIIQQVEMGKLKVDQAQAKIMAINAQLEADMAATTNAMAQQMGRTANLTTVPLTGEAVVDKAGKSNLRSLFRQGRASKKMLDVIARAVGVKTYGGGYSIETTIPKKFAVGGSVPGVGSTDTVPAMLTPGEFVVNAKATRANLPLLQAINGAGSNGPGYDLGSSKEIRQRYQGRELAHLTDSVLLSSIPITQRMQIARQFELTSDQVNNPKTRVNTSLFAAYHKFFNQMTNHGTLPSSLAIDYLSGNLIKDPMTGNMIKHDPMIAYEGILTDLGVPVDKRADFVKQIDNEFIATLKAKEKELNPNNNISKITYISDKEAPGKIKSTLLGNSLKSFLSNKHPELMPNFKKLMGISEVRFTRPGSSTRNQQRKFASIGETASNIIASIVAKKKKPTQVADSVRALFPKIKLGELKQSGAVGKYSYTKIPAFKNQGGLIGFNKGGLVPGYQNGGEIPVTNTPKITFNTDNPGASNSYPVQYPEQQPQTKSSGFGKAIGSNLLSTILYSALSMGGGAVGQKLGGTTGGFAGSILAPTILNGTITKLGALNRLGASSIGIFSRLGPALLNPYVAAGVAVAALGVGLFKLKQRATEAGERNRLAFAGGVKPLEDFNGKIKAIQKSLQDARAARELLSAQFTSAGLPGLVVTAAQFKQVKDEIAKTYPKLVDLIKNTSTKDLQKVALGLKAQFVAAGDSAAYANEKIAALLQLGGKGGMLAAILGGKGMSDITNAESAIKSMLSMVKGDWLGDSAQSVQSILQIFTSSDDYIGKQKDSGEALKTIFNDINSSASGQLKLTSDQVQKFKDMVPELGNILTTSDTIASTFAKWKIVTSGVTKDLSGLSNDQLQTLAEYATKVSSYFDKLSNVSSKEAQSNKVTGLLAKDIDKFNKQQAAASKAAITSVEDQISAKEKLIAAIKKEAEARKKALQDQQQIEDTKLQIQQEQLNYQNALASGDMSSAAQAQINIQRLVGQQQLKAAENAIDDATQKKIDALQAEIDALNKALATKNSADATVKTSPLQGQYDRILAFLKDVSLNNPTGNFTEEQLTSFNSMLTDLQRMPGGQKYVDALSNNGPVAQITGRSEGGMGNALGGGNDKRTLTGTSQGAALSYDLQNAINANVTGAKIDTTNSILKDILVAVSNGRNTLGSTNFSVSSNRATFSQLSDNGISFQAGTKFTDKSGIEWQITGLDSGGSGVLLKRLTPQSKTTETKSPSTRIADRAIGGLIRGPGTGTSDSIPTMLSNGEYVVRAASVQAIGTPTLDRINKMAAGGLATKYDIPRMNMGGIINYSRGGLTTPSSSLYNINVTLNGSNLDANDVAKAIHNEMKMREIVAGRRRTI
jgi:TP901 family phage tail tape measure protein